MIDWSKMRSVCCRFSAKAPQRLLSAMPSATDSSICKTNFPMIDHIPAELISVAPERNRLIHNGVMNTPIRLKKHKKHKNTKNTKKQKNKKRQKTKKTKNKKTKNKNPKNQIGRAV